VILRLAQRREHCHCWPPVLKPQLARLQEPGSQRVLQLPSQLEERWEPSPILRLGLEARPGFLLQPKRALRAALQPA